jgi:hypothetical protein
MDAVFWAVSAICISLRRTGALCLQEYEDLGSQENGCGGLSRARLYGTNGMHDDHPFEINERNMFWRQQDKHQCQVLVPNISSRALRALGFNLGILQLSTICGAPCYGPDRVQASAQAR